MPIRRLLGATSFRLALLQSVLFLGMFLTTGAATLVVVRRAEAQAVDAEISAEVDDLSAVYAQGGLARLRATIEARQRDPSIWEFRVEDPRRQRLAGDLPALAYPAGWSRRRLVEGDLPDHESEVVRMFARALPDGLNMIVGEDLGARERADDTVLSAVGAVAALVAAFGLAAGAYAGQRLLGRIGHMAAAVDRFGAGELDASVEVPTAAPSDLDQLALALNRMMARTRRLMDSMRQVTADIAHDLRRPLAHHNQRIERVLHGPASLDAYRDALAAASAEVDEVLQTFQALLQIAELEAGAPGLELRPVDLLETARRVVDAYAPLAEETGRSLALTDGAGSGGAVPMIRGEPRLLTQMLANMVENALTHTPQGCRVEVVVDPAGPKLIVSDDGPGVPEPDRQRIFERFVRLDASRSRPGAGLGLALAAAIAAACDGRIAAEDAAPGLRLVADFSRNEADRA